MGFVSYVDDTLMGTHMFGDIMLIQVSDRVKAARELQRRVYDETPDVYVASPAMISQHDHRWLGTWKVLTPKVHGVRRALPDIFPNEESAQDFSYLMNMARSMRVQAGGPKCSGI